MLKKKPGKNFAWIYFCGQKNRTKFVETDFRGFTNKNPVKS